MEGNHRPRQDYDADGRGDMKDIELSVLINEGSASSSEIFAGAIQDNDRGVIVGRRSFGKGLVQEPINFTDGSGIRLTVARFYTPSGRCIQKPYDENYNYDIFERYAHGEMTSADSMKVDSTALYYTVKGRRVYGGGGIIPDTFVPIDTTKASKFFINCNKKAVMMRFASNFFDGNKTALSRIDDFERLDRWMNEVGVEQQFLNYAAKVENLKPAAGEWEKTRWYMMPQVKALVGRYSKLQDEAFYRFYLPIDNEFQTALTEQ
jgi:carboxyl-terminal processing protease